LSEPLPWPAAITRRTLAKARQRGRPHVVGRCMKLCSSEFFGKNHETAVTLVRLDDQDILADGQTAICTSHDPFVAWECSRRIEQRLDGPTARGRRSARCASPATRCPRP